MYRYIYHNTMIALDSFVFRGGVNHYFPLLLMQKGNFPGKFSRRQSMSQGFPSHS